MFIFFKCNLSGVSFSLFFSFSYFFNYFILFFLCDGFKVIIIKPNFFILGFKFSLLNFSSFFLCFRCFFMSFFLFFMNLVVFLFVLYIWVLCFSIPFGFIAGEIASFLCFNFSTEPDLFFEFAFSLLEV